VSDRESRLRELYDAFNARRIGEVIAALDPDVDWPNAMEGTRVHGHDAVREYWTRQFEVIQSRVEPEGFETDSDRRVVVSVHQVVHDPEGNLVADNRVRHAYTFGEDGMVARMDILDA
jgi:hypothetical protein